ncbi:LysR family transcriptional regulator [Agaricicola taiwanensis]|uniref:LysR family transcriptional regulator n=1 Tax=Agaricicola taiwanensis TaxID=591372 RepID=A0A8J2VGA4_9RHOB|nr:LysR family transcriptional regulator [Agaricicola taiwanensis]GGE29176.1 LysR family transcriptional regulator [Agaricicola taiwanensis]
MNIRFLEIFVSTIDNDGMSNAAEKLGLSQSAVSQAIANLEKSIGKQLLDRTVRPSRLTLAGSVFYEKATGLLNRIRDLEQMVDLDLNEPLPVLRIGMVDSFAATAGPALVKDLETVAGRWLVGSGLQDTSVRALLERRVDLAITSDETMLDSEILSLPIFEEPFFLVAPNEVGPKTTIEALVGRYDFIRYARASFIGKQVENHLSQLSQTPSLRYEFDTSDAVMAMVSEGIGWTITTPLVALKSRPSERDVSFHPLPGAPFKRRLWLIARKSENSALAERVASAARRALIQRCLPRILEIAPWMKDSFQNQRQNAGKS